MQQHVTIDEAKLQDVMGKMVNDMGAANGGALVILGAQAGPKQLGEVLAEAGFTRVRIATQTPFNLII